MLLLSSVSFQAFVHGSIYSEDLEELGSTVLRIEGPFSYQLVTHGPDYSIFLPEGRYTISASHPDDDGTLALYAEQEISVGSQDQEVDLVLRAPDDDLPLLAGIALVIAALFLWSNRFWRGNAEQGRKRSPEARKVELDGDARSVLAALEASEGRASQKELRQALGFSDSKLSLILTELEHLGKVKRFKRGRANVVRRL
jgi:hypothetical protein